MRPSASPPTWASPQPIITKMRFAKEMRLTTRHQHRRPTRPETQVDGLAYDLTSWKSSFRRQNRSTRFSALALLHCTSSNSLLAATGL